MAIGALRRQLLSNSTYDSLYNQSLVAVDPISRRAITDEMQRMIYRYASYIMPLRTRNFVRSSGGPRGPQPKAGRLGNWSNEVGLTPDTAHRPLGAGLPRDNLLLGFGTSPHRRFTDRLRCFPRERAIRRSACDVHLTFGDGKTDVTTTTPWVFHTYGSPGVYAFRVRVLGRKSGRLRASHVTISQSTAGPPALPLRNSVPLQPVNGTSWMPFRMLRTRFRSRHRGGPRGDPITVTWAFGDGTTETDVVMGYLGSTDRLADPCFQQRRHYQVVVSATDGKTGSGQITRSRWVPADPGLGSQLSR